MAISKSSPRNAKKTPTSSAKKVTSTSKSSSSKNSSSKSSSPAYLVPKSGTVAGSQNLNDYIKTDAKNVSKVVAQVKKSTASAKKTPTVKQQAAPMQNAVNNASQNLVTPSYTGGSVVDYLTQSGQSADFASRAKLAAQNGIQNYTGTAAQNGQLLNTLRGSINGLPPPPSQEVNTAPAVISAKNYQDTANQLGTFLANNQQMSDAEAQGAQAFAQQQASMQPEVPQEQPVKSAIDNRIAQETPETMYGQEYAQNLTKLDKATDKWNKMYNDVYAGRQAIPYSKTQKTLLSNQKVLFDETRAQIQKIGESQSLAQQTIDARTGRNRYAPEIAEAALANIQETSARALRINDAEAGVALAQLEQGFNEENLNTMQTAWNNLYTSLTNRQQTIVTAYQDAVSIGQAAEKLEDDRQKEAAATVANALIAQGLNPNDLEKDVLEQVTAQSGIDVMQLFGAYQEAMTANLKTNSFELGEGQSKYVYDPATGTYKVVASKGKTYAPTGGGAGGAGGTMTPGGAAIPASAQNWAREIAAGRAKLTDVPSKERTGVVQAMNAALGDDLPEVARMALSAAQDLKDYYQKHKSAVGFSRVLGLQYVPGLPGAETQKKYNTLIGRLKLDAAKYLKGTGALSDAEQVMLGDAATELSLSSTESSFQTNLDNLISALKKAEKELKKGEVYNVAGAFNNPNADVFEAKSGKKFEIPNLEK